MNKKDQQGFFTKAAALGASYVLGTFNDNFFKQAVLLLAVGLGLETYQAWGTFLFALPFVLFSAWGGWLADRFPKKNIVVAAKSLELLAMLVGAWGIVHLHWPAIMFMLFCMGGSSTLFSPALNGSIPELFPAAQVPKVNGLFKLCTTVSILLGVMLAGWALDRTWLDTAIPFGRWLVASGVICAAVLGLGSTVCIPLWPASDKAAPAFPWLGAWNSLKDFHTLRRDPALRLCLAADATFYGISALALLLINALGRQELGFSNTLTSLLPTALLIGICAGSLLAARGTVQSWRRWLFPACSGIGLALIAAFGAVQTPLSPQAHFWTLFAAYTVAGVCGGFFIIPVSSFIQVRPESHAKGHVLGICNCLSFTAIMLAGPAAWVLTFVQPSTAHLLVGLCTLAIACVFALLICGLPREADDELPPGQPRLTRLVLVLGRGLLALRYRVTVSGLDKVRDDGRPLLFLPNHVALSDPMLVSVLLARFQPRPLADEAQVNRPLIRPLMQLVRPVTKPDLLELGGGSRQEAAAAVEEALNRCIEALKQGDNLLFYPAGMLTQDGKEHLGGKSGVLRLIRAVPECRVILVRTRGLWGSSFSYATGKPDTLRGLALGALRLLANGLFFMPRRTVRITFQEMDSLPVQEGAQALNRVLESWYEAEPEQGSLVPYYFWQGSAARPLPAHTEDRGKPEEAEIPEALQEQVYALIRSCVGEEAPDLQPEMRLAADLGIDSLSLTELAVQLEQATGHSVTRLEELVTVADCVRAAAGLLSDTATAPEAPAAWFAREQDKVEGLQVPDAPNLPLAILRQARQHPTALILTDAQATLNWQDFWLKAVALSLLLRRQCPESRVGLLLPASTAASLCWLAVLLAGKTPVLLNWTTGPANFAHCVRLVEVKTILTARRLLDRLKAQGFDPDAAREAGATFFCLEEAAGMPLTLKVSAFLRSRLALAGWERLAVPSAIPETAAILFTSGSESAPKGVPLSHENILTNCRDITEIAAFTSRDRMLAMLPPFHSLGLTVNLVLPLCFGLPAVMHPNPTEAALLVRLCRLWRPTITVAPPTFLDAMLQQAAPGDLRSLRLGVVGAETCPARVYQAFAQETGGALVEGYGVTECAPVISVNRPAAPQPGTIGLPLPSVQVALVSPEGEMQRVPAGKAGMLLVRGPNVFSGYVQAKGQPAPASPFVTFEGQSWYRTGDLVRQQADGVLVFAGRLGRFVKVGGEMLSLPQMEQVLLDYVAKRDAGKPQENEIPGPALAVASVEREGQPEMVLVSRVEISLAEANQALRNAGLSALYALRRVLPVDSLPLLGSGKTDYRAVQGMLEKAFHSGAPQ